MFVDAEIRYHFPIEVNIDDGEPVFLEQMLNGTSEFVRRGIAPNRPRNIDAIRASVRNAALTQGGEAWRAVTERGEVLCTYSVVDRAIELGANSVVTLHPLDQFWLAMARWQMAALLRCRSLG
jgi:hypothetical protein